MPRYWRSACTLPLSSPNQLQGFVTPAVPPAGMSEPRQQVRMITRSGSGPDDRDPQALSDAVSRLLAQRLQ